LKGNQYCFDTFIEAADFTILMTLTGVFTGLYMGGHTALRGIDKWRGGKT